MSILSNNFYYQPLKIDSINTKVYGDFVAKEGDANGRGLLVTLTENGLQKDTTGITLNLKWAHTTVSGLQNLDPFESVDLTKGLYKITYPTDMLRKGKVDAFIQIIDSGKLIGSRNIKINVEATVGDDTAIESSNEFRALASALVEVQGWNARIDDVEQEFIDRANNLDATYPTRLVSVEEQLAQSIAMQTGLLAFKGSDTTANINLKTGMVQGDYWYSTDGLTYLAYTGSAWASVGSSLTELSNVRSGADGVTYATAGEAVRGQFNKVKDTLSHLDLVGDDSGVNYTAGSYINSSGALVAHASYVYSDAILLKKGDLLVLKATGYLTAVSMISYCDNNNTKRNYKVMSTGSTEATYTHTATIDGYVSVCFDNTKPHELKIYKKNKSIFNNFLADVTKSNDSVTYIDKVGYWIYPSGNGIIQEQAAFATTAPFAVKKGQTVKLTAIGYGTTETMIATCDINGANIMEKVRSIDNTLRTYEYTSTEDGYCICSGRNSGTNNIAIELVYKDISEYADLSMFEKWGVVGDSFASGVFYDTATSALKNHLQKSWPQILARKCGNACINFSKGGLYCGDWLTNTDRGLPFLLSSPAQELYVLALGINDVGKMSGVQPLGTVVDINDADYTQNPFTFYGNYGKIIAQIKAYAPKAKLVMITTPYNGESSSLINNAIVQIAAHYGFPCIKTHEDSFFLSDWYWRNFEQDHPKSPVHAGMANTYDRLIKESIVNNMSYFGNTFN